MGVCMGLCVCVSSREKPLGFLGLLALRSLRRLSVPRRGALQVSVLSGGGRPRCPLPAPGPSVLPLPFLHLPGLPASSASKRQAGLYLPRLGEKWPGLKGEVAFQALN